MAQGQEGDPKPPRRAASSLPPIACGVLAHLKPNFHETHSDQQDCRRSTAIFCSTRTARTYFINFYMHLTPRCARLLPPPHNSNLCRELPESRFGAACTQRCGCTSQPFISLLCCWGAPATPGPLPAGSCCCDSKSQGREAQSLCTRRAANCKTQQLAAEMLLPAPWYLAA